MALLFSFSVAMDKFVIGRVVTAIHYQSIQFSIRLAVATVVALLAKFRCSRAAKGVPSTSSGHRIDDAADLVLHGGPFLAALYNTRMHRLHASAQLDVRIGSPKTLREIFRAREAFVAPIDTKVSIDTIVQ
jgi:hypothetical protein